MFEIDPIRGLQNADVNFLKMMLHRRHIYEHNDGVMDERYVVDSGDPGAREGVLLRESRENANRLLGLCTRMVENMQADFHELFPLTEWPINYHQQRLQRIAETNRRSEGRPSAEQAARGPHLSGM
jgi:hypothetical protein